MKTIFFRVACLVALLASGFVFASAASAQTTVSVDAVTALPGSVVSVPLRLSQNSGICGMALKISYDSALTLLQIDRGDALSSLAMTRPGDLSANPFRMMWDGMEADASNGVMATLVFSVPEGGGVFPISLSCTVGDIVDGNLNPLDIQLQSGGITTEQEAPNDPCLSGSSVTCRAGETVSVPLVLSDNTGICGMTLQIAYDPALSLESVSTGDALSSLTFTRPGDLNDTSICLIWDGMDADTTSGTVAILTFTAPEVSGDYPVTLSCRSGDVVNGALLPVALHVTSGAVCVENSLAKVTVKIAGKELRMSATAQEDSSLYVAFYTQDGRFVGAKQCTASSASVEVSKEARADSAKVMWLTRQLAPLCAAQETSF